MLFARLADAELARDRGRTAESTALLQSVVAEAGDNDSLVNVHAAALMQLAALAFDSGAIEESIWLAWQGVQIASEADLRDRLLSDVAYAFEALGMLATARDALSAVVLVTQVASLRQAVQTKLLEIEAGMNAGVAVPAQSAPAPDILAISEAVAVLSTTLRAAS
jgi:hypothetical protein